MSEPTKEQIGEAPWWVAIGGHVKDGNLINHRLSDEEIIKNYKLWKPDWNK